MSDDALYTITTECTIGCNSSWQCSNLVAIRRDVGCDIIFQAKVCLVAVTDVELETTVFHLTCINPLRTTFTHYGNTRHIDEDILCLLEVPVKVTIQSIAEESEVETKVGLCGRLPLDIVVTYLITLKTRRQGATTIGTCDVVRSTIALPTILVDTIVAHIESVTSEVVDFLVTSLSPRSTNLQVVNPRSLL